MPQGLRSCNNHWGFQPANRHVHGWSRLLGVVQCHRPTASGKPRERSGLAYSSEVGVPLTDGAVRGQPMGNSRPRETQTNVHTGRYCVVLEDPVRASRVGGRGAWWCSCSQKEEAGSTAPHHTQRLGIILLLALTRGWKRARLLPAACLPLATKCRYSNGQKGGGRVAGRAEPVPQQQP
jgi:hypothetical protein